MDKERAIQLYIEALAYSQEYYPDEILWAKNIGPQTFECMTASDFMREYCWVNFVSGFKAATIETLFPRLRKALKNFELDAIARMQSTAPVIAVFGNKRKAQSYLDGAKMIAREGFQPYKKRLKKQGAGMLEELPGIGPVTKFHLAKNIGLVDAAKPDVWLERAAKHCRTDVKSLVLFLSNKYHKTCHAVDVVLWRYGVDRRLGL